MPGNDWDDESMDNQENEGLDRIKPEEEETPVFQERHSNSASKKQPLSETETPSKKVGRPAKKTKKPTKNSGKRGGKKKSTETEAGIFSSYIIFSIV